MNDDELPALAVLEIAATIFVFGLLITGVSVFVWVLAIVTRVVTP